MNSQNLLMKISENSEKKEVKIFVENIFHCTNCIAGIDLCKRKRFLKKNELR